MVANSRCSVVTVRPAATRTHAFTRREWTSNPAHRRYRTSILHLLIARRWRGVHRNEIYKTRLPGEPGSQYGVLVGLRVQLYDGLSAPRTDRPLCQRHAPHSTPVSCMRGSGSAGWRTVWRYAGRVQIVQVCSRHCRKHWFSRPRLVDRLPLPSSDLLAFPTAPHRLLSFLRSSAEARSSIRSSSSAPRRCAPAGWPAPRRPACAACASTSGPATGVFESRLQLTEHDCRE